MTTLSPERRRVVGLTGAVAAMSSGPMLLKGHQVLIGIWLAVTFSSLAYALVLLAKLKRRGL